MQRAAHISAILKRILFIGISIQTIMGMVWICCNYSNIPQFGESFFYMQLSRTLHCDEYTGILYPFFLWIVRNNHYVVYMLQLTAAYAAANRFLSVFSQMKRGRKIWACLAFLTMPVVMQCHAAVLPCSFAGSLLLLELALLIEAVRDTEKRTLKRLTELSLCWLTLALLLPEYLYLGAIPVLLFCPYGFRRWRKQRGRKAYGLLLIAIFLGMILSVNSLTQTEGAYGKVRKTPLITLTQRISWPSLLADFEGWQEQVPYYSDEYTVRQSAMYADAMDRVFFAFMENAVKEHIISDKQVQEYYKILIKDAWEMHRSVILRQIAWDIVGYGASPAMLQNFLSGNGYDSYSGRNYEIFLEYTPKLSKLYMDYGSWWFTVMLPLTVILHILLLSCGTLEMKKTTVNWVFCCLLTAGIMVLWYTMRGAGMLDYKNTILIDELWTACAVLPLSGSAVLKTDRIKAGGKDLRSEQLVWIRENFHKIWFFAGLAAVAVMAVPYLILGENAVFTYHDQLDGELIAYILQAKHLFQGNVLPEFMGGMSKTALTLPAPGFVLLFRSGNYFTALLTMQIIGSLVGYLGMYLLVREVGVCRGIAAATGVFFAYLPFLPVYGLSQYGIPLLFWCVLQLKKKQHVLAAYLYMVCFCLTSSLVLVGFGLLGMGVLWLLWLVWKQRERVLTFLAGWLLMLIIYIAENFRLLGELFSADGALVSHKSEYMLAAEAFFPTLWRNLTRGGQHSEDYHLFLLTVTLIAVLAGFLVRKEAVKRLQRIIGICLLWNLFLSSAAAFSDSAAFMALRSNMAALKAFQTDRLLWIAPVFWYLAFACGGMLCAELLLHEKRKVLGIILAVLASCGAAAAGVQIFLAGDVKSNIRKMQNPDYGLLSFADYYAIGVMPQVGEYLRETTGLEPSEYRVVSLGIDPAAALYHGFYCLDGYSNNYALEYKHSFRRILAPELERSDYLREYFDRWGNRCYLFSSECPGYYTIEKGGFYFQDYRLDAGALKELGGDYLLSAAYIANAAEQGLILMNENPLETEESYYRIYIYEVAP